MVNDHLVTCLFHNKTRGGKNEKRKSTYIIGAGPGDFELLTLKAKRIIENADCIIYDRLISEDILKLAKKRCRTYISWKRKYRRWFNSRWNKSNSWQINVLKEKCY